MGNVILIGFMGCGKSSVAVKLSYRMKQPVTDTDKWIEAKQGKTVSEIFEQDGEDAFRRMETEALKYLKETAKSQIISAGGGLPLKEENRALLKEIGKVVYIRAKPETVYDRIREDTGRPLLRCENPLERIGALMEQRRDIYEGLADFTVDVDGKNYGQILYEIERGLRPAPRYTAAGFKPEGGRSAWIDRQPGGLLPGQLPLAHEKSETRTEPRHPSGARLNGRPDSMGRASEQENGGRLKKLLVINGPNINFLGIRERGIYGTKTYEDLLDMIAGKAAECRIRIDVFQSNHEGAIIDRIQAAYYDGTQGIVINPGAYTHYSYAIRDALESVPMPKIEVHISNIMEREEFRHTSVTKAACSHQIYGHGLNGYLEAVDLLVSEKNS